MIEYFYLWFIFSLFGAWIGQRKKRIAEGFLAGLLLGPIGLIWIALQKPKEKFRDFVVQEESEKGFPGFINLIGIESPGLTSSLAIAERILPWLSIR